MSMFLRLIYRLNTMLMKFPAALKAIHKTILKVTSKYKGLRIAKAILKNNSLIAI